MPENPYGTMLTTPGPGGDWYDPCILADYYYTYEAGNYDADGVWQKGLVWSGGRLCCRLTGVRESTSRLESNGYFSAKNDNNQYYNCVLIGIAPDAFKDQRALDQIEIPETVQRIGEGAFNGCSWLESITIPDSVTYIGSDAFSGTGIQTATMPALAISSIPKTSLKTVVITSGWSIGHHAFEDCKSLTSITIPDSVLSIGDYAFKMCTSLASITIPNSVSSLGQGAFQACSNLVSINIPDSVTSISNGVFQNCSSLGSIEIQNNVTSIGEYAFDGCSSLKGITIPSSVTTIGFGAIQRCTSLTSITIPFVGHTALNQTSGSYLYRIGYIFGASAGNAADALPESLKEIIVNQGTPFLANQAFAYADKVKTIQIKLADSVKAFCFGRAAFYGCTALETFKLTEASEGVAPILDKLDCLSDSIFANCYYLATIVLPHTKAFAASAYEALQIQTAPVAVDLETPGLPATLIGKGQTADYNIFLQITPPTNIAATNFSIDGLYGNVTINGQTTLKRLASMSSIKTSYEKLADHISHDTPSDFVEALSNISLVSYSPVSVLQMYYSLELTFNDGTQANVGVQTSTCSAINVLEEDEAGNYVTSTRISYDTSGFLEQIDSVWRPLPLTTVQTLVARRSTGTQAYSTSTIGGSFFAYTSARLGSGTVSITAPQRLIHAFMRDTNDNKYRLNSIAFSCTTDESEVGGFAGCSSLASASYVSIYDNDELILADYAFSKCSNLTSFSSEYITGIGYAAFQLCSSLETVVLPNARTLDTQDRYGFDDDWGDAQSAVGSSLAFYNCANLTRLQLAFDKIETIGDYAFAGCTKLSWDASVLDWALLKNIGYHAFLNCSTLTTIGKIDSVQNIYFGAFQGCISLTGITVPRVHTQVNTSTSSTLEFDNFGAFFGGSWTGYNSNQVPQLLETVTIKGGVNISPRAFEDCSNLTSIILPNSLTSIGHHAFEDCSSLTSITIPNSVTSIGGWAFWNCVSLSSITVDKNNTVYHSAGNCLIETKSKMLIAGCKSSVIPSDGSVTSIGSGAFSGCSKLTSITIPSSVTSIGDYAFSGCTKIPEVVLPNNLETIGAGAFEGCERLTTLVCNTSLESIGAAAFAKCPIKTIQYYGLNDLTTGKKCSVGEGAFTMTNAVNIKLASYCTIKEWCRMSFKNPSPLTKNMKFFEEDGSQNGRSIVQTFDLLPTDSANFGNYCFWGWKVDQPLVVFWPDDGKTRTLGDGALAINGKVYYYSRDDDACVTPGNTDPNVATEVIPNFGLNSNNKDWETVDSPSPLLQNLSAEIDIKQLEAEYSKFESNLNRLNLTNTNGTTTRTIVGYHVDFTGVTIQVPASQIRVATGNLPGCKRTLFQTEANNGNNTKLTLSIGQYVSISNKSDTAITITFYNADSLSKVFGSLNCTIQDNIANIPADETMIIAATATATEGE